jgi:hypothetical protein
VLCTACYQKFRLYETRVEPDPRLGFSHVSAFVGHRCQHGGFVAFPLRSSQGFALSSTPAETMAYPRLGDVDLASCLFIYIYNVYQKYYIYEMIITAPRSCTYGRNRSSASQALTLDKSMLFYTCTHCV